MPSYVKAQKENHLIMLHDQLISEEMKLYKSATPCKTETILNEDCLRSQRGALQTRRA